MSDAARGLSRDTARSLALGSPYSSACVGPAAQWNSMGATKTRFLTALGLRENHRRLDFGCGSLRAGRLLTPCVDSDCFCAIEPNMRPAEDALPSEQMERHLTGAVLRDPEFSPSLEMCA